MPHALRVVLPPQARTAVKKAIDHLRTRIYYRTPARLRTGPELGRASEGTDATLIVVAFNEPQLVEWQLAAIQQHFSDSHVLVIADNSTDASAPEKLQLIAKRYGAVYVSLPRTSPKSPSDSHGLALNWVHRNLLPSARSTYVAFLDHDIFPIRTASYRDLMQYNATYGRIRRHGKYSYYWPGFFLFRTDFFVNGADFRPHPQYGDTGAANWPRYYSDGAQDRLKACEFRNVDLEVLKGSRIDENLDPIGRYFELIDEKWVHPTNGSNWRGEKDFGVFERRQDLEIVLALYVDLPRSPRG